jgi:hypothetical protein
MIYRRPSFLAVVIWLLPQITTARKEEGGEEVGEEVGEEPNNTTARKPGPV